MGLVSLITSISLSISIMAAQTITTDKADSWYLQGAVENISDLSAFSSECATTLWAYDGNWNKYEPSGSSNTLSTIQQGKGFWLKSNQPCTITLASGSSTANPTTLTEVSTVTGGSRVESVIYDQDNDAIYASNINGNNWDNSDPSTQGWIARFSGDFQLTEQKWVSGIDSPKGMGIYNGKLYVADIDKLRQIDIATGTVETSYDAPSGYNYLNDVTVCGNGDVYVSNFGSSILRLSGGSLEVWVESAEVAAAGGSLDNLNGLYAENGTLVFGGGNNLYRISTTTKEITTITTSLPTTDNDGIAGDGNGGYYVSDYNSYAIYHVQSDGSVTTLSTLSEGAADLWYRTDNNRLYVPTFNGNSVIMYEPQ